jgi:hypothetical protein
LLCEHYGLFFPVRGDRDPHLDKMSSLIRAALAHSPYLESSIQGSTIFSTAELLLGHFHRFANDSTQSPLYICVGNSVILFICSRFLCCLSVVWSISSAHAFPLDVGSRASKPFVPSSSFSPLPVLQSVSPSMVT